MGARICVVAAAGSDHSVSDHSVSDHPLHLHPSAHQLHPKLEKTDKRPLTQHKLSTTSIHLYVQLHPKGCSLPHTHLSTLAYILCLLPWPARPTAALLRPRSLTLSRSVSIRTLAIGWFVLVAGPRASGKEPSTESPFVGRIAASFYRNTTWTGNISCFGALRNKDMPEMLSPRAVFYTFFKQPKMSHFVPAIP